MVFHLKAKDYISEITGCGYSKFVSDRDLCQLHDHEFYEFVLVLDGTVIHEYGGNSKLLSKNNLMLIRPLDIHRFKPVDAVAFSYVNLAFSQKTFKEVLEFLCASNYYETLAESFEPPVIMIKEEQARRLDNSFMRLIGDEFLPEPRIYLRGLIASVISKYFVNKTQGNHESQLPHWFTALCDQMKKPENFSGGIEKMSQLSGKSYGYIGNCFRNYLGISPTAYINNIRLEYASKMLKSSNLSIADICDEAGYNNLGYFYRNFKKKYGVSPSKYREEKTKHIIL